jgi:hypothetical protein
MAEQSSESSNALAMEFRKLRPSEVLTALHKAEKNHDIHISQLSQLHLRYSSLNLLLENQYRAQKLINLAKPSKKSVKEMKAGDVLQKAVWVDEDSNRTLYHQFSVTCEKDSFTNIRRLFGRDPPYAVQQTLVTFSFFE